MECIIVTGMSGSGKNTAFRMLEDFGYFCVDNLPVRLIDKFLDLALDRPDTMDRVVLGIDIRGGENIDHVMDMLEPLFEKHLIFRLLFLDSSDECLVRRYKESRRVHPLAESGRSLEESIALERERLRPLRERADVVIDTSMMLTRELQNRLYDIFVNNMVYKSLNVTVLSFGYKFGIPQEADMVLDVRFLPNPYYEEKLRNLTGNDPAIQAYVLDNPEAAEFLEKTEALLDFLIPQFIRSGKNQLTIAVGCTGGKHRSVSVSNRLYEHLLKDTSYGSSLIHRDVDKPSR